MAKLSKETFRAIISGVYGIIFVGILAFALLSLSGNSVGDPFVNLYLFFMFLLLSISRGLLALFVLRRERKNRVGIIKNIAFATVYMTLAILSLVMPFSIVLVEIIACAYMATVIANRICLMIEKKKIAQYIIHGLLTVLAGIFVFAMVAIASTESAGLIFTAVQFVILMVSLVDVLAFAFSKIQLRGLIKIIRKTYVLEILYGLVILVFSFSFYFALMEDSIPTFWDGLWYSFAVITTIGFGDLTATSVIGRILTVILGLYGIIVVASITSVIVNFYNEVRAVPEKPEEAKEEAEEPEKDENKEETPAEEK